MIAPERGDAVLGCGDEILDHRRRNVVAVQRGIERRRVAPGPGVKPVALQHAVVEGGVGVLVVGKRLVECAIRGGPILLPAVGFEQRAVLTVAERHPLAAGQRQLRELHVGGRERRVAVVRNAVEAPGKRHQPLPLLVEDMLLLVEEALDREPVTPELVIRIEPHADRLERDRQQLGIEPGAGLLFTREQDLDLLPACVDLVVPLILVVLQRGEVPDAVAERAHLVHRLERRQQISRAARQGALPRLERFDRGIELVRTDASTRPSRDRWASGPTCTERGWRREPAASRAPA